MTYGGNIKMEMGKMKFVKIDWIERDGYAPLIVLMAEVICWKDMSYKGSWVPVPVSMAR